jgi:hypothetical protein
MGRPVAPHAIVFSDVPGKKSGVLKARDAVAA